MFSFFFASAAAPVESYLANIEVLFARINTQLTQMQDFLQDKSTKKIDAMKKTCEEFRVELKTCQQRKDQAALAKLEEKVAIFRAQHLPIFLRLRPTQIDAISGTSEFSDAKEISLLKLDTKIMNELRYKKVKKGENEFCVFAVTQDLKQNEKVAMLIYVGDAIKKFKELYPDSKATLLFPVAQHSVLLSDWAIARMATSFASMFITLEDSIQKQHFVLLQISLSQMQLEVHNSGMAWKENFFPDTFSGLAAECKLAYDPLKNCHIYEAQKTENVLCGRYVIEYGKSIIATGNASALAKIQLDEKDFTTSDQYIRAHVPNWGNRPQLKEVDEALDCDIDYDSDESSKDQKNEAALTKAPH